MAEGRYIRDEKSPSFVPRTRVQQCARSEVPVPRRPAVPLWRVGYVECCGQEQLLCDGGSVASTVESPGWCNASAVCKSSMLCCCSTAVANSPCMRVAPILQVVDQRVLSARKKKRRASVKKSAFTKFKYVAERRYICDEKSPSFVPRTRVQRYARSEVRVPRRAAAPLRRVGVC